MRVLAGFEHVHVTEREVAHMSPCGWDDAKWEDCTFMSALEWWRATGHPDTPATHEEGEHLRCASGRSILGGTNLGDVRTAIRARYKAEIPATVSTFGRLWDRLVPGTVAVIQGSMAAFPSGHRFRRWQTNAVAAHAAVGYRLDATDRIWWCDPLAPVTYRTSSGMRTYDGEWMSKADLKTYVDGLAGSHLVGTVVPTATGDDIMRNFAVDITRPAARVRVKTDAPHGMLYIATGQIVIIDPALFATREALPVILTENINATPPTGDPLERRRGYLLVYRNSLAFMLSIDLDVDPVGTGYSQAELDAAVASEKARAQSIASAAKTKLEEI